MIYDIQKASVLKRFSAFLLDFILIVILAAGFMVLWSWVTGYDRYSDTLDSYYETYEEKYGVDFSLRWDNYDELSADKQKEYKEAEEVWDLMFKENPEAQKAYRMTQQLPLLITTLSILPTFLVLEFIVPLFLKNGQTVGKKVFSIGVVFKNSVQLTTFALFVRAIFGKYTIGTMFPVLLLLLLFNGQMGIMAIILLVALLLLQIVLFFATKNHCFIHDILANTVVADMQSQMTFTSTQELIAYQEEVAKAESANKDY